MAPGSFSAGAIAGDRVWLWRLGLEGGKESGVDGVDRAVVVSCNDVCGCSGVCVRQGVNVLLVHTHP